MIERLVPKMAEVLRKGKQWENPNVPLDDVPQNIQIGTSEPEPMLCTDDSMLDDSS